MNPAQTRPEAARWLITLSVMIPTMIEVLDTSVANVSLTHIQGSLSAGQEEVTWVLTSYLVANAVIIPMSGWLAKVLGRKRYLLASLVIFTLSSLLCGTATSLAQLIFFRIMQGLGGGGLQPISQAILLETYPPHKRGLAMAIFGMGVVVGPILGPLLGGYLTDNYSWRWIFYINLPIGLLALYMNAAFIRDPDYQQRHAKGDSVDYVGLVLLCLGIGALQMVLDMGQQEDWFSSRLIVISTIVAVVCLTSLVYWELKHKNPVIDLRILKNRSFATGNVVMFLGFFAFFGSIVLLPLYLQSLMGYSAYLAGIVLGPGGMLTIIMLPLVGKATEHFDARKLLAIGLCISAYSVFFMSGFNLHMDLSTAITGRILQGVGIPFFFVALSYVTMAYVPKEQMNNASAIFNLLRNLGGSFGTAFVTTLVARRAQFHQNRLIEHMNPYNPGFNISLEQLKQSLAHKMGEYADTSRLAGEYIYAMLKREAASLAFLDAFHAQGIIFLGLVCILWIMKKPPIGHRAGPPGH